MTTTVTVLSGQCVCTYNLNTRKKGTGRSHVCEQSGLHSKTLSGKGGRGRRVGKRREGNKKSKFKFNGMIVNIVNLTGSRITWGQIPGHAYEELSTLS